MMLTKLLITDARVASAFSKTFGTVDVDRIVAQCDDASERRLIAAMSGIQMQNRSGYGFAHAS